MTQIFYSRTYLLGGTPPSVLASHCTLAILSRIEEDDASYEDVIGVFQNNLRSVAQKVQESIGTDKPNIARPAREAKELLKRLDDGLYRS